MKKISLPVIIILIISGAVFGLLIFRSTQNLNNKNEAISVPQNSYSVPSDWQTFSSDLNKFQISYPKSYDLSENGANSVLITPKQQAMGQGSTNFIYISFVPQEKAEVNDGSIYNFNPEHVKKLSELEVGKSTSVADPGIGQDEWYTFERLNDENIGGIKAKVFKNKKPWEFPAGTNENRFILEVNGNYYLLGFYSGGDSNNASINPEEALKILQTLKFN